MAGDDLLAAELHALAFLYIRLYVLLWYVCGCDDCGGCGCGCGCGGRCGRQLLLSSVVGGGGGDGVYV